MKKLALVALSAGFILAAPLAIAETHFSGSLVLNECGHDQQVTTDNRPYRVTMVCFGYVASSGLRVVTVDYTRHGLRFENVLMIVRERNINGGINPLFSRFEVTVQDQQGREATFLRTERRGYPATLVGTTPSGISFNVPDLR